MMKGPGGGDELTLQKRALLDLLLHEADTVPGGPDGHIPRRSVFSPVPQSFAQRRLWMLEALRPGTSVYTIRTGLRLTGGIDHSALQRTVNEVVRRHESLRTTFTMHALTPVQVVADCLDVDLPVVVRGDVDPQPESWLTRVCDAEAARPFDLERGPLFRSVLIQVRPDEHLLLLTLHHIVADGWSLGILLRELSILYQAFARGQPSPLPELPIQYGDFALWQQQRMSTPDLRGQLDHWREQVADLPALVLPIDRPRPERPSMSGERQHVILSREVTDSLVDLSRREGATLYMTLLAAFQVVLSRWCGQEVFGIGTPIASRNRVEIEDLIGFFLNTLVMRADLTGDPTFRDLLARVRETTLTAYAHQDVPFERLLESVRSVRDAARTPLFQVFLNMLNFADDRLNRPVAVADAPAAEDFAQFDLTLYAGVAGHQLQLQLVHSTEVFDRATAGRILGYLATLLGTLVEHADHRISALPILAQEARPIPSVAHGPVTVERPFEPFPAEAIEQSLTQRFAEQVRRFPDHGAVRAVGTEWTYAELGSRVEQLARQLHVVAPGPGGRVGILCDHDAPMVAALLSILRCGHAYVPLDPAHPNSRLAQVVTDAQVVALVASGAHLARALTIAPGVPVFDLGAGSDVGAPIGGALPDVGPDAHAYLLYTSGSTGRPKGVLQNHRNVLHHVRAYTNGLQIGPGDCVAMLASYGFDAAVMDIFGALLTGATLCIYDIRDRGLLGLREWLDEQAVTVYHSTPTVFRQAFDGIPGRAPNRTLRAVVLGGEEVLTEDFATFRRNCPPGSVFVNGLGPTESTLALQYVVSGGQDLPPTRSVPVGYPVEGTEVLLRNDAGEDVEVYGVGTIIVVSRHVALGYWRRPELTRSAFQPAALDPRARQYVTGDLGRLLPDGAIEFVGRRDGQVKIRGQRVEVGEVQARLLEHPAVRAAVVSSVEHPVLGPVLVAHVILRAALRDPRAELRTHLRERLPEHMVPAAVVPVEVFPLTVNGKVDHSALPPADFTATSSRVRVRPQTDLEEALASLFAGILGLEQVGTTDDFFELGGHSLLATQLLARVRTELQVELPLAAVFREPTVLGLAQLVQALPKRPHDPASAIAALPRARPEDAARADTGSR